jgi:oligoribonuclease
MYHTTDGLDLLPFVDIETGGIPSPDYPLSEIPILEVAIVVCDSNLTELDHKVMIVSQPRYVLEGMTEWARKHHSNSGLIEQCLESDRDTQEVALAMSGWLYRNYLHGKGTDHADLQPPMCGNSVHYDRKFLEHHMPMLSSMFSYRNIDVSTLKELAKRWDIPPYEKGDLAHRGLDDLRASIAELKHYRQYFGEG